MNLLAIDPGNIESAYCVIDSDTYNPIEKNKIPNESLLQMVQNNHFGESNISVDFLAIEMVASYGMPVGKEVFDTCVWIGRFIEAAKMPYKQIYRKEEKINLCNSMRAKDSNIRQALIDRFGVVGTKKQPGFFYGFKKDIWAAYAVGCTYLDTNENQSSLAM